jgi:hypothetical protein
LISHKFSYEVKPMHISNFRRALKSLGLSTYFALVTALFGISAAPSTASAQVVLSVTLAPPVLPVYTQPICPGEGYLWTPGYWSYSEDGGYFWVPGTWVEPPAVGLLWTPGYWGWSGGAYLWNAGYWGPEVGFYGGINYGFGYVGTGYFGGRWDNGHFFYNTRVNNVNVHVIHNVYSRTVVVHESHVSFNGCHGGINARPTAAQELFAHEQHTAPTEMQERHVTEARSDRNQFASANHGHPSVVATARPGEFKGAGVVQTKASASDRIGNSRTENRSEAKPRTEPATRTESKTRTEPKTEAKTETAREPRTEATPKTEAKPKTESKPAATREPKTEAKPKTESKPAATREPKTEAKPKTESTPATTREPNTEAKPKTESKPAATREPKPEAKPKAEPKPTATHEPKPEAKPKAEPKPAATHESKPAATHEPKPEAKPEAKPESAPKPAATHEAKPPAQHESAPAHDEKPKS